MVMIIKNIAKTTCLYMGIYPMAIGNNCMSIPVYSANIYLPSIFVNKQLMGSFHFQLLYLIHSLFRTYLHNLHLGTA